MELQLLLDGTNRGADCQIPCLPGMQPSNTHYILQISTRKTHFPPLDFFHCLFCLRERGMTEDQPNAVSQSLRNHRIYDLEPMVVGLKQLPFVWRLCLTGGSQRNCGYCLLWLKVCKPGGSEISDRMIRVCLLLERTKTDVLDLKF